MEQNQPDEGYIKFRLDWLKTASVDEDLCQELGVWRDLLYKVSLIGFDQTLKVGYGNASIRLPNGFLITGTQTGHLPHLRSEHYTVVTVTNVEENYVQCQGPIAASSESMTHSNIYACDPEIKVIFHVHENKLWNELKNNVPTTSEDVPYGTPAMANEINRLWKTTDLRDQKILVMAGHEGGIISFGRNCREAINTLVEYYPALFREISK